MFANKTVFVVGAGASVELNLPTGDMLMPRIRVALQSDQSQNGWGFGNSAIVTALVHSLRARFGDSAFAHMEQYRTAAQKIVRALPYARSIDTYLESQKHDGYVVHLGKLAITSCILDAEKESYLIRDKANPMNARMVGESWYDPLAKMLTSGHNPESIQTVFNNVSFVTFNYDRCLETFLYRMLDEYFDANALQIEAALVNANIVHAYGQVGRLPWQTRSRGVDDPVPFGGPQNQDSMTALADVANGIKTYTETADSGVADTIKGLMTSAETIVFMGFGYLKQNLELLRPIGTPNVKRILGTAYGLSSADREAVRDKLVDLFGLKMPPGRLRDIGRKQAGYIDRIADEKCRAFMDANTFALADQ